MQRWLLKAEVSCGRLVNCCREDGGVLEHGLSPGVSCCTHHLPGGRRSYSSGGSQGLCGSHVVLLRQSNFHVPKILGRLPFAEAERFHVVAYLQQMWWFEIRGTVKFPFPVGVYSLSYRLHLGRFSKRLGRRSCSYEHTHGWDIKPVKFELSTSDGQQVSYEVCLEDPEKNDASSNSRRGNWINYQVGQFIVSSSDLAMELTFSMKQIDCTHSKGGICVDSVSIVPGN